MRDWGPGSQACPSPGAGGGLGWASLGLELEGLQGGGSPLVLRYSLSHPRQPPPLRDLLHQLLPPTPVPSSPQGLLFTNTGEGKGEGGGRA